MSIDQVALESIDIDRLPALIGTDESQLSARLDYLQFSEKDARLLLALTGELRAHCDRCNEHFFGHLKELAASQPYFSHPVLFEQLKHTQPVYFSMRSEGRHDECYVCNRVAVGMSHQRIGLQPE